MTYGEIYRIAKQSISGICDYRPASGMFIEGMNENDQIPNAIVCWLENGDQVIYVSRSETDAHEESPEQEQENSSIYKGGMTIRRNWCQNIDEIGRYLSGGHDFPGVYDDLQEKWAALENAESIVSISWDAKEERYLVVFRQRA